MIYLNRCAGSSRFRTSLITVLTLALLLVFGQRPVAATPLTAFSFTDPLYGTPSVTGNDGFKFLTDENLWITALGYYDRDQNGLALDHQVGIFDVTSNALLASTTVGAGAALDGLFRYNSIAPLLLNAGASYMVVGFHPGSPTADLAAYAPTGLLADFSIATDLTYQGYFLNYNSSLSLPTTRGGNTMFYGPNFQYEKVPEPSTLSLLLIGFAGIWRLARRQA